jgi:hypothetical protein
MYKFILQSSFNNIKQNQIESNCIPLTSLIFVLITIDLYTYYIKKKFRSCSKIRTSLKKIDSNKMENHMANRTKLGIDLSNFTKRVKQYALSNQFYAK